MNRGHCSSLARFQCSIPLSSDTNRKDKAYDSSTVHHNTSSKENVVVADFSNECFICLLLTIVNSIAMCAGRLLLSIALKMELLFNFAVWARLL